MGLTGAGSEREAYLPDILVRDVDMTFSVSVNELPADGAVFIYAVMRRAGDSFAYRPKIFITAGGAVFAHAGVMRHDREHSLGRPAVVPGLIIKPDQMMHVRAAATGSDPTILRVRVWSDDQDEPTYWNFGAIDWTGSLQGFGSVGLAAYLGVRHPGGRVDVNFLDLTATTTDLPSN
jgi:hypothetical protein